MTAAYILNSNDRIIAIIENYRPIGADRAGYATVAFAEAFNDENVRVPVKTFKYRVSTSKANAKRAEKIKAYGNMLTASPREKYWFLG